MARNFKGDLFPLLYAPPRVMNLLIILWLLMVVACELPCTHTAVDIRALRIHQNACHIFKAAQAIRDQQAVTGESAFDRRTRKKRQIEEGLRPQPSTSNPETWKLLQQLPAPAPPVVSDPSPDPEPAPVPQPATATWVWNTIHTTINGFGLYCEYPSVPSYNSDKVLTLEEMSDIPTGTQSNTATITANLMPFKPATPALPEGPAAKAEGSDIGPFLNWGITRLMGWQWTGSPMKSIREFKSLLERNRQIQ
ncbi:hypothetical protein B0H14DRAFT_2596197 [Mycena olivaceomarginata]|nr:hypothetical protein B0H14DRAFT_2596197 [Mycena olivaceomarginata]